jgi:hypothetical protein
MQDSANALLALDKAVNLRVARALTELLAPGPIQFSEKNIAAMTGENPSGMWEVNRLLGEVILYSVKNSPTFRDEIITAVLSNMQLTRK